MAAKAWTGLLAPNAAPARRAALLFGAAHTAMSLGGIGQPVLYGFLLGPAGSGARVRTLAALDLAPTLAVAHAAATGRPLRARLRVGAASDIARAAAVAMLFGDASLAGRVALITASLAGAALALGLSARLQE